MAKGSPRVRPRPRSGEGGTGRSPRRADQRPMQQVGTLFLPPRAGPHPAVLVVSGGGGGIDEFRGAIPGVARLRRVRARPFRGRGPATRPCQHPARVLRDGGRLDARAAVVRRRAARSVGRVPRRRAGAVAWCDLAGDQCRRGVGAEWSRVLGARPCRAQR